MRGFLVETGRYAAKGLGLERLSIEVGQAAVAMIVLPSMVNGLSITHGAAIFTLADSVFALACNAYNERTISAHCSISPIKAPDIPRTASKVSQSQI
jgi:acyl-coenzyme A thioesterase PaaI-like protein